MLLKVALLSSHAATADGVHGAIIVGYLATSGDTAVQRPERPEGLVRRLYPGLAAAESVSDEQIMVDAVIEAIGARPQFIKQITSSFKVRTPVGDLPKPDRIAHHPALRSFTLKHITAPDREYLTLLALSMSKNEDNPQDRRFTWDQFKDDVLFEQRDLWRFYNEFKFEGRSEGGRLLISRVLQDRRAAGHTPLKLRLHGQIIRFAVQFVTRPVNVSGPRMILRTPGAVRTVPIEASLQADVVMIADDNELVSGPLAGPPPWPPADWPLPVYSGVSGGDGQPFVESIAYVRGGPTLLPVEKAILGFGATPFFSDLRFEAAGDGPPLLRYRLGSAPDFRWISYRVYVWDSAAEVYKQVGDFKQSAATPFPHYMDLVPRPGLPNGGPAQVPAHFPFMP